MKKTILAIAIPALFASAANAAVVYDKDGTSFDIYGRVQANYYADSDNASPVSGSHFTDAELVGYSRLGWSGTVALNNTWSAIAKTEWQVASENSNNNDSDSDTFKARHIYVGFDGTQYGKFLFGQTDTAYYDAVAATDIFNEWGSYANGYGGRQEGQIIYRGAWNGFTANASYQTNDDNASLTFGSDGAGDTVELDRGLDKAYALSAGYTFDFGLGLNAGVAQGDYDNDGEKFDWAISTNYGINGFYFAAMYNETQVEAGIQEATLKGYELAASYNVDAWTFLAGYNNAEIKDAKNTVIQNEDWTDEFLLGAQYAFTPKLKAYTEYKIQNVDDLDDEFTVALQYNF